MVENDEQFTWTVKLDWLNVISMLKLESINQISEIKKEKAIRRITKTYSNQTLAEFEPADLDKLVVNELKELMKKELLLRAKKQERMEKEIRNKIIPMKKGGIIRLDPNDLKNFKGDPKEMMKFFYKKLTGEDDDDRDDDNDNVKEDNNSYYI